MMVLSNVESRVKVLVRETTKTWPYVVKLLFSVNKHPIPRCFILCVCVFPANIFIY